MKDPNPNAPMTTTAASPAAMKATTACRGVRAGPVRGGLVTGPGWQVVGCTRNGRWSYDHRLLPR